MLRPVADTEATKLRPLADTEATKLRPVADTEATKLRPVADTEATKLRPLPVERLPAARQEPGVLAQKSARLVHRRVHWRYVLLGGALVSVIAGAWISFRPDHARPATDKTALPAAGGQKGAPALPPVPPQVVPAPAAEPVPKMPEPAPSLAAPQPRSPPAAPSALTSASPVTKSPPTRAKRPAAPARAPRPITAAEQNCVELLSQLSLGVDTPELRAKLESLHCPGSP
jgi:hypothetical protein